MRESCTYGVVRGALSNERPYRDRHCPRRGASAPNPAILCGLLQRRQNSSILGQGCAGLPPGSANRCDQFTRHLGRTSPPLRPCLGFRYTQVNRVDSGNGVAILTDMFGGTPCNLAISCMSRPKVEVLAGINLPMLVKLAKVREEHSLPEAIAMAQEAGRKYVTIASRVLAGKSG
jgi:PTS system mannose-specific IIA component